MNNKGAATYKLPLFAAGLFVFLFYVIGAFFPEVFWATHTFGVFPLWYACSSAVITVVLLTAPFWIKGGLTEIKIPSSSGLILIISLIIAGGYLWNPIVKDLYGDAFFIRKAVDISISSWDNRLLTEFLKPDWLDSKVGLKTYYQLNNFFTWLTGKNGLVVSRTIGAITGGLFAYIWITFSHNHLKRQSWKWLFSLLGIVTPLSVVFMGHYETYHLSYLAIVTWMSALGMFIRQNNTKWLLTLPLLFIIILQTHITNWLLLPSLVLAYIWFFKQRNRVSFFDKLDEQMKRVWPSFKGLFSWNGAFIYIGVPVIIVGSLAYFVIFANHDGPRQFSKEEFENTLFLPLYTAEPAPFDRYNLFSLSHIWDYFNLMHLWSGAVVFLLIPPLTFLRQKVAWEDPLVLISGVTAIIFFLIFFILNPLLGPVIDWDLFCSPGLVVLPFLVFVYKDLEEKISIKSIAGPVLAFCFLAFLGLWINASPALLEKHYALIGKHNFKTYWIGSSTEIIESGSLTVDKKGDYSRLKRITTSLEPYAVKGNDKEYANLIMHLGLALKAQDKLDEAIDLFLKAERYSPNLGENVHHLTVAQFESGDYQGANTHVRKLVEIKYPPFKKTLQLGVRIALLAKDYQHAADLAVTYLNRWEDDPKIVEVERRLRSGDRINQLVDLYND